MKMVKSIFTCVLILLLSGCTAIIWSSNNLTRSAIKSHAEIKDRVTEVVQYQNLQLSASQAGKITRLNVPSQGVAFSGEKNIYILTKGAEEILRLNDNLHKIPLSGKSNTDTIRLKLIEPVKGDLVRQFADTLIVKVNGNDDTLNDEQRETIRELGFSRRDYGYEKRIEIRGVIIPVKTIQPMLNNADILQKSYKLEFYSEKYTTKVDLHNIAENIIVTPFTLAADIVFFPISLSVLVLMNK